MLSIKRCPGRGVFCHSNRKVTETAHRTRNPKLLIIGLFPDPKSVRKPGGGGQTLCDSAKTVLGVQKEDDKGCLWSLFLSGPAFFRGSGWTVVDTRVVSKELDQKKPVTVRQHAGSREGKAVLPLGASE